MRASVASVIALGLSGAGCASLPSLPDSGFRSIITSHRPSDVVSTCIVEAWRKSFADVSSIAGTRENEIQVGGSGRPLFEAEVIAQTVGSTIVYTTPYGLARPVGHSFDDAQSCAAK